MAEKRPYARLSLATLAGTRRTLSRIVRELYNGDLRDRMEQSEARLLVDSLKALITAHKAEADLRVEQEIQDIRARLKSKGIL